MLLLLLFLAIGNSFVAPSNDGTDISADNAGNKMADGDVRDQDQDCEPGRSSKRLKSMETHQVPKVNCLFSVVVVFDDVVPLLIGWHSLADLVTVSVKSAATGRRALRRFVIHLNLRIERCFAL